MAAAAVMISPRVIPSERSISESLKDPIVVKYVDNIINQFRGNAASQQRKHGHRHEIDGHRFQERPGDRDRNRGLLEEVVRGKHRHAREAVRRQVAGEGDRTAERICQDRV